MARRRQTETSLLARVLALTPGKILGVALQIVLAIIVGIYLVGHTSSRRDWPLASLALTLVAMLGWTAVLGYVAIKVF